MGAKERRERERASRKKQIIDAARDLLLEKGLHETTINQISKRSELSIGAIYFYFKSKEEIYAELQIEANQLLNKTIKQSIKQEFQPEEKLRTIANTYMKFSINKKNYFDIMRYFTSSPEIIFPQETKERVDKYGKENLAILADVISEGVNKRVFKNVNPWRQAIIFWTSIFGIIQIKKLEKTLLNESISSLYSEVVEQYINYLKID